MIKTQTLKGFRDFLPLEARKRQYVINTLKEVFEYFDFQPLETPALEYEEILSGKYGDEGEKLMYRFEDIGQRKVAMRYDQTVPLARIVAQYKNELPMPFMRYQIQPVWRGENTQKGRYREFLQCDADIVGSASTRADAQIIMTATIGLVRLGFTNFKVLINDRELLQGLSKSTIIAIDKLKKIGRDGVIKEILEESTMSLDEAKNVLEKLENAQKTNKLTEIFNKLELFKEGDLPNVQFVFSPTLARGLDYYTGMIFEIEIDGYDVGSVCGGGRYDNLIGIFADQEIPAVGFAYGFDRIMEAIDQLKIPLQIPPLSTVLVTIFSSELEKESMIIAQKLRNKGIKAELYLGNDTNIEKQLKYADRKGIPYVLILGPKEIEKNLLTLRNMQTREQKEVTLDQLLKTLV